MKSIKSHIKTFCSRALFLFCFTLLPLLIYSICFRYTPILKNAIIVYVICIVIFLFFKMTVLFDGRLLFYKYIIPHKHREEIIGDLCELKSNLNKEGHSKLFVNYILSIHIIQIIFAFTRIRLMDVFSTKKQRVN